MLYPSPLNNKLPAIKWGTENEKLARNLYVEHMRENGHEKLVIEYCGFIIIGLHEGWLVGVRPMCQHNFGNNRMLKEPRIMLE